ncbi:MAG: glycine cleavage T C-terminal barrel domain-containing protein, partial [Alphaproteobacteria bacterium]
TVLEAGLGFAVAWDKPGGFIGREALLAQRDAGITRRLLQFLVTDPEPLLYHNEPIWRDGVIVGKVTSGMYGHTLGGAVGMGYVSVPDGGVSGIDGHAYEIEIAGVRYPARASLKPLYDPASSRLRG